MTAPRPIVADASPLIGLAAAEAFGVLRGLYRTVTITRIVKDEVLAGTGMPGARELDAAMRSGWIRVAPAPAETWQFPPELGAGEASTIALAKRLGADALVLMDDEAGRAQAQAHGVEALGTADVLLAAQRAGLVGDLGRISRRLARRGFVLPEAARRELVGR